MNRLLLSVMLAALLPGVAIAQDDAPSDAEPAVEGEGEAAVEGEGEAAVEGEGEAAVEGEGEAAVEGEGEAAPSENGAKAIEAQAADPLRQRMDDLVQRYYEGTGGTTPSDADRERAVQSIQLMLLDGVSLDRINAAVDEALKLHTPGRRIPFEVAVPLRVRPEEGGDGAASGSGSGSSGSVSESRRGGRAPVRELTPEEEARRLELRRQRSAARARLRLFRQWRERTRVKQTLLSVGIPLLAGGYALGFGHAGILALNGLVPHYSAWITAVPVIGNFVLTIWTNAEFPASIVLTIMEWGGVGLIVAGLLQKIDWPYDRDPTAWKVGKRQRDGRAALTMRVVPTGAGGALIGRW